MLEIKVLAAVGKYCTQLEDLNLWSCKGLTDTGLILLAIGCGRTLKSLGIAACVKITDASLAAVGLYRKSLEKLLVDSEFIHNKGLLSVAKGCPQLKSLRLQCRNLTDEALLAVGKFCQFLELLALYSFQNLTDKNLCVIGKGCKKLKNLTFINCDFLSDIGLDSIAVGCTELMRLEVNGCQNIGTSRLQSIVGTKGIITVGQVCRSLTDLTLKSCNGVGDLALISVGQCCSLTASECLCKKGKIPEGIYLLDQLLKEGLKPSTASYTVLIEKFCEARNVGETKAFWKYMVDRGVVLAVSAYDSMILGLSEQGNVAEEMQWLGTMLKSMLKPQKKTFERLVQFYLRLIGRVMLYLF
ncbi:Uncharacterized protein Fot_23038 [Forsythia ovata]|uniref:F-box/LRR-repeat protein 15-like leucin rich repeat domain-containing protein n=1 Tax=Forsythia ovata TaxID=205694 RepID=A0ABD1UZR6_9LAMI